VIAVDHPALWIEQGDQIVRDLVDVLTHPEITPECLEYLLAQQGRLVGGQFETPDGRGCLMRVLTEPLSPRKQIRSRSDLVRFFGRGHGRPGRLGYVPPHDSPEYQPAKWLVRLVDGQICRSVRARYGRSAEFFDYDLVLDVAQQVLNQREEAARAVERTKALAAAGHG
jgi:hypothetical protein